MATQSSVVKSAQNASEIGWAFVPQYYTFVNKDPSRLHCFYTKRSTLIHSTEGEEATPCFGQQEIHEKFMSLNFDDCKVFVSNVDSQSSADGGIIVQVLGEMSNEAGPWRKFAQTFFLAEQPNGFFVLNDIFRYMKEEDDDEEAEAEPVTVTEDVAVSDTSLNVASADAAAASQKQSASDSLGKPAVESASTTAVAVPPTASPRVVEPVATPEPPVASSQPPLASQLNGFHPESREAKPPEQIAESSKAASKPVPAAAQAPAPTEAIPSAGLVATSAAPAAPSVASSAVSSHDPPKLKPETAASTLPSALSSAPSANGRTVSTQSKSSAPAAAPSSALQKPAEPSQPPAPKTWASLAASGKSAWGQGHLSSSQGVSSAPSAASTSVPETQPLQSQNRQGAGPPPHSNPDRYPPVETITTGSCFIKSVNENIDEKTLRDQLVKKFGPIKELDIVRTKACGFLEFERIESAKKAIQMSMPYNMGGKGGIQIVLGGGEEYMINIESKRQPGERGRPVEAGPKRGFGDRGGRTGGYGGPGGGRGRGGMDGGPRGSGRGSGGPPRGPGRGMPPHSNK